MNAGRVKTLPASLVWRLPLDSGCEWLNYLIGCFACAVNLNIRITKDEAALIQECADLLDTTRTDVIIQGVKLVKGKIEKK